jgi:hypothetical protein
MAVKWSFISTKCDCGHRLWIGDRDIGPAYVICKKCNKLHKTGFGPGEITKLNKIFRYIGYFFKEFFTPTFWCISTFLIRFWLNIVPQVIITDSVERFYCQHINPHYLEYYFKNPDYYVDPVHEIYYGISLFIWPTFLIIRYLVMVRNSEKHQDINNPVYW